MIIAKEKKATNIAEYILYMWQIEDLLRAYKFDIKIIEENLISKFDIDKPTKADMKTWYLGLIDMMGKEKIKKKGHLIFMKNTLNELYHLHKVLLITPKQADYLNAYNKVKLFIGELAAKTPDAENEIDLCFTALYGSLILKLQKKQIRDATAKAIEQISKLIALLAQKYHLIDKGELDLSY